MGKLTFKEILNAVQRQILFGKTYLASAKALETEAQSNWTVFGVAPTFFGMTIQGNFELAQMTIARLYDKSAQTVTVKRMLCEAVLHPEIFQVKPQDLERGILDCAQAVIGLQPTIDAIKKRRDRWLAHLDEATVRDPNKLTTTAKLTTPDLDRAFAKTEEIFQAVECLYDGTVGEIRFVGGDDYKSLFKHIRQARDAEKKEFDRVFKRQFGHTPPDVG